MPLTRADKQQIDDYIKSNQPHLARLILQDHLKDEPFDETARRVLGKINDRYPATPTPPAFPAPPPKITPPSAIKPKKVQPPPALRLDSDDGDIDAIKQAIREKRYEDAEALLILSNHPDAEVLRQRLAEIRGKGKTTVQTVHVVPAWGWGAWSTEAPSSFTSRIILVLVFFCLGVVPGLIVLPGFVAEAKRYPDVPGANAMLLLNKIVFGILAAIAALFLLTALLTFIQLR